MSLGKKRECARYVFPSTIEFCLAHDSAVIHSGETMNIGRDGLCVSTSVALEKGQLIRIRRDILPFFCDGAEVKWVEKHERGFKAGLMFISRSGRHKGRGKQSSSPPTKTD